MTTTAVFQRQALRAAVKIHEQLRGPPRLTQHLHLPQSAWDELCRTMRHLRHAEDRGWSAAVQSLRQDLDYAALRLQREMESLRNSLPSQTTSLVPMSAGEIASDLIALAEEFEQVEIDLPGSKISVVTAGIELEGVLLGAFRIVLRWDRLGQQPAYDCEALEPNAPSGREDVTHPHVQDDQLCEGEGSAAIKAALSDGRIHDFFVLVRQILGTYNSGSAHVSLEDWNGRLSCHGCGSGMSEDDYSGCEHCDERFCSDCSWCCQACSRSICSDCSSFCAECDERCCDTCLAPLPGTSQLLCSHCLNNHHQEQPDETKNIVSTTASAAESQATESPAGESPPATPTAPETSPSRAPPAATTDAVCLDETPRAPRPGRNGSGRLRRQPSGRSAPRRRPASRPAAVLSDHGPV